MRSRRRALTRVDLLASLTCAVLLLSVCAAVTGEGHGKRTEAWSRKDSTQLREIHQAMLIFANEFDGLMPRPGLIDRLPDEKLGRDLPGRGPEDPAANTTANLYSALIVQNYFVPELVISPVERNPKVKLDEDFDWNKYNPVEDVYWDDGFGADLRNGSNASYAHLVLFGDRVTQQWKGGAMGYAALANRGPLGGERDAGSYTCGPHGHWNGNVVFSDNHSELTDRFSPPAQRPRTVEEEEAPDNIFAMEDGPGGADTILSFTQEVSQAGAKIQHD